MDIEDFMRQSYNEDAFEFNEKHWEGAKLLLDREFSRRILYKKILVGAVTTLLLIVITLFLLHTNGLSNSSDNLGTFITHNDSHYINDVKNNLSRQNDQKLHTMTSADPHKLSVEDFSMPIETANRPKGLNSYAPLLSKLNDEKEQLVSEQELVPEKRPVLAEQLTHSEEHFNFIHNEETNSSLFEKSGSSFSNQGLKKIPTLINNELASLAESGPEILINDKVYDHSNVKLSSQPKDNSIYITTSLRFFPSETGEPFDFMGLSLGGIYQGNINNALFYETGLSFTTRTGNFSPSISSTQLSFDFDIRENAYVFRPTSVYSLEVPVMIGFKAGKHQLSAGVLPAALLGVYGDMEYRRSLHPWEVQEHGIEDNFERIKSGWLNNNTFNRLSLSYSLRYMVSVGQSVQLGLSAHYRPSDWVGNNYGQQFDFNQMTYTNNNMVDPSLIKNWIIGFECRFRLK